MDSVLPLVVAYLLGSIPFGLLCVAIVLKKDVRTIGSGNIGATNVSRAFQKPWQLPVFFLIWLFDMAKGFVPITVLTDVKSDPGLAVATGLAAIAGHCFSVFLKFKGGKGVSTVTGVFLALQPLALVLAFVGFGLVLWTVRIMAIASMTLGFFLVAAVIVVDPATAFAARLPITGLAIFLSLFLIWTHRANIRGLRRLHRERKQSNAS